MRLLIIGGYGMFGARLARLLADEPRLTLLIGGRSMAKARVLCESLPAGTRARAVAFDRDGDLDAQLRALAPAVVVDATGPFQAYGDNPYRVVKACLATAMDYLDFADASEFVGGVAQFDAEAKSRGVYVLSGVSSFPVLTAAVVRRLARDMTSVLTVHGGIAPSPFANVGPTVIDAIAGYAGQQVPIIRHGKLTGAYALTETLRYTIAPPGALPLVNRRFSLVDVPEYRTFAALWPTLETVWMGAGPIPTVLHRTLNLFAWLVRWRLLPTLRPLAPLMYWVITRIHWGEHRGGMFVAVTGEDLHGTLRRRSWHLLAEQERGPVIPSMAIEMLVRKHVDGAKPPSGARAATLELELADYERVFATREVITGERDDDEDESSDAPLYRRLLGTAFHQLPPAIRAMHDCRGELCARGVATVERGRGVLVRVIAAIMRLPQAGASVPVTVEFRATHGRETWRRTFGDASFASELSVGRGRSQHLLVERFGPLRFAMALVRNGSRLEMIHRRFSVFGIPLPRTLAPSGPAHEHADDGRFHFNVEIRMTLLGLIVAYRGWLIPE